MPNLTVLLSGRGSNMQALHKACSGGLLNAKITHVISNRPEAAGLTYASDQGIKTTVVDHHSYANRTAFDQALGNAIDQRSPDLILLAGFMRKLSGEFTQRFASRLINIHPSLLPHHPGLNTHQKVIECGDKWHGCSIHYVTEKLDGGPVIARSMIMVTPTDTPATLASRVLKKEHQLYWQAVKLCVGQKIECQNGHILYCGKRLLCPILI